MRSPSPGPYGGSPAQGASPLPSGASTPLLSQAPTPSLYLPSRLLDTRCDSKDAETQVVHLTELATGSSRASLPPPSCASQARPPHPPFCRRQQKLDLERLNFRGRVVYLTDLYHTLVNCAWQVGCMLRGRTAAFACEGR